LGGNHTTGQFDKISKILTYAKDFSGVLHLWQFWQFHKNVFVACGVWRVCNDMQHVASSIGGQPG